MCGSNGTPNNKKKEEIWPDAWKLETVTTIPKAAIPESLDQTRNISCTPVLSKVLEFFVLQRLKKEKSVSQSQYGGMEGIGTNHYIAEAWTNLMEKLNQDGSAACLVSVDFAKAFNTMCHIN